MKKSVCYFIAAALAVLSLFSLAACDGERVTVRFEAEGGQCAVEQITAVKGKKLPTVPSATREGYEFVGWYFRGDRVAKWNFSDDKVKGDMTLYAGWKKADGYVTVEFDLGTDEEVRFAPEKVAVKEGERLPEPVPERSGYEFVGWFTDAEQGEMWDFETDEVRESLTLFARWKKICRVTIMDGTEVYCTLKAPSGEKLALNFAPCDGAALMGIYEDSAFKREVDLNAGVDGDKTYYAQFLQTTDESLFTCDAYYDGTVAITDIDETFTGDTLVIPETIGGRRVVGVHFYHGIEVKEIYISRFVTAIESLSVNAERWHISSLNNKNCIYDDCLYYKNTFTDDDGKVGEYWYLHARLDYNKRVVRVLDRGVISSYYNYGVYFILRGGVDEHFLSEQIEFGGHIVVEDEYYDEYVARAEDDLKEYIIRLSEFDETEIGREEDPQNA